MLLLSGETDKVRKQMNELRLEVGQQLGLRDPNVFAPLWVIDFLFEWDEETERFIRCHPFTSPKLQDIAKLESDPATCKKYYDLVMNEVK